MIARFRLQFNNKFNRKGATRMMRKMTISLLLVCALFAQEVILISNDNVAVAVDRTSGQFAIGTTDGTPLTYGYPDDPHYTHLSLLVGDETYSNKPGLADYDLTLRDSAAIYDNTISIVWNAGPRRVWEKFYTLDEDSLRGFIYIEYIFYNDTPESLFVGLLEYMDIQVGENNAPTVELPDETLEYEMSFSSVNVPSYWIFYEDYDDTLSACAWGVPFGREDIYVDDVVFSDVEYISDATWNFSVSGRPVTDLATLLRWDMMLVSSYGWYCTGHYYGLGYPGVGIEETLQHLKPTTISFGAPYPNPTNGAVSITIEILNRPQNIGLNIISIDGKQIKSLKDGVCDVGKHTFRWDLTDECGNPAPSGMYVMSITAGRNLWSYRIAVVR